MKRILVLLITVFIAIPVSFAQDDSPLLTLLSHIPNTLETVDSVVSYVDYNAMFEARTGSDQPESINDLLDPSEEATETVGLWMAALRGVSSGPAFISNLFAGGSDWETVVGFDFFAIGQAIEFGNPPSLGTILLGEFDPEAIATAFSARNFASQEAGDFTLWCGEAGCEEGMQTDLINRNPANPFGGQLGRSEPILVSETVIVDSADFAVIESIQSVIAGDSPSLADNPAYMTAYHAIPTEDTVLQTQFLSPGVFLADVGAFLTNQELVDRLIEQIDPVLQPYELVAIADTVTESEQIVYLVLVYGNAEDAESAVEIVPARIEVMDSFAAARPFTELLADREISAIDAYTVGDDTTGKTSAVFAFHAPLAPDEPDETLGYIQSSMVFRLLIDMVYRRDMSFLIAGTIE